MVRCDNCKQRYHKACIGLGEAENLSWTCQNCSKVMEKVVDVQGSQDLFDPEVQKHKNSANIPTVTLPAETKTVN